MVASRLATSAQGFSDPLTVLANKVAELQRMIEEQGRRTLQNATINSGGLTIENGGTVAVYSTDGSEAFYLGQDANGKRVVRISLDNGRRVMTTYGDATGASGWTFSDSQGGVVVADDSYSGHGLARPWLALGYGRAKYTSWEATTSSAWETLWNPRPYKQHPKVMGLIRHTTDVSDTTGNWQLIDNNNGGAVLASGAVSFAQAIVYIGPVTIPGALYSPLNLALQAQRTAGTGAVRVELDYLQGVQS